ncbi:MAG: pantoate--beta-alanine ligase [Bacteroidota bacterium]
MMKQFTNIAETKAAIGSLIYEGKTIGFVPTMGALHEGHLTLIRRAKLENDIVVCSIFVNPTQFNNKDDLFKYPRNIARDARMLEANGCDIVFAPEVAEMYPNGEKELLNLKFGKLDKVMEGKFRPGHFQGVATIVNKLFEIVKPTKAYFGKKDYQQLAIIREMVNQLNSKVEIVGCETVREPDGFAMSSRNMQLTIAERQLAPTIFKVLQQVKQKAGVRPVKDLKSWAIRQFGQHPEFRVEYFEISHRDSLMPIDNWRSKDQAVALVAVFIGDVRLIDNLELFS